MHRPVLGLIFSVILSGCAPGNGFSPSFLGASELIDDAYADEDAGANVADPAMRYVTSNKVLGAMAFQKVTGRTVDPDRLTGRN